MVETQKSIHEWCKATFPKHIGEQGRAVALLEEAVELALAAGVKEDAIMAAVKVPILKETIRVSTGERERKYDDDLEEMADVLLCLYAYAEERGGDAHAELDRKMVINRGRSTEYYAKKTAHKQELGFILPEGKGEI
jgi:NTP pyrophosphatase (non-canonical NTP hydrolase)